MTRCNSSADHCVLVSDALLVSHGQIGMKEVPGWCRSCAILLVVMVERRQGTVSVGMLWEGFSKLGEGSTGDALGGDTNISTASVKARS